MLRQAQPGGMASGALEPLRRPDGQGEKRQSGLPRSSHSQAPRALRPCVTFRKITNGFRTEWGARLESSSKLSAAAS